MNLLFLLFLNLIIFATLSILSFGLYKYNKAWYLRKQRTKYVVESFYDKFILLEVRLPREVNKSPQAMEFIFDVLHQGAGYIGDYKPDPEKRTWLQERDAKKGNYEDKYKLGLVKLWMTLEIESRGGEIHFYIGTIKKYKELISSYIFSQYPGIEVTEVDDYTDKIRPVIHGGEHDIWTGYLTLDGAKKDYFPIKTYVDYGLDKDPKDEFKIDPLIPFLESMANIKSDEHVWSQILIRPPDKEWKKEGLERIDAIMGIKRDKDGKITEQTKEATKLSLLEKNEIELIERNISKLGFETLIKTVYIAPKGGIRAEADQIIRNAYKTFNNQLFNTLKLNHQNTVNSFLDYADKRIQDSRRGAWFYLYVTRNPLLGLTSLGGTPFKELYERFKKQGYRRGKENFKDDFIPYFKGLNKNEIVMPINFILNSEELATIYHFPSKAFSAPKFGRIESVKSEAPINLPI